MQRNFKNCLIFSVEKGKNFLKKIDEGAMIKTV